ncbi:hypothetical protein FOA52_014038 [Chlamydomonas sp. UWO 241]|nr:hypothetical protein FOA52_014038 [Chlamydomonas sp. UWO 241]
MVVKQASSRLADAMDAASAELDRAVGLGSLASCVDPLASCGASGPALGLELLSAVASGVQTQDAEPVRGAPPESKAGRMRGSRSSFLGVVWNKASSSWLVRLWDPLTKRQLYIGCFASEEDAARAYDHAAVQAQGPGAKCNFPGEAISEPPVSKGDERKQQRGSRFLGVRWSKSKSSWLVKLYDRKTKRCQHIGSYTSEEGAAQAYDRAAVQAHGPGAKRNFHDVAIGKLPS